MSRPAPGNVAVEAHADGCVLTVKVKPGARQKRILGVRDGVLHAAVHAPPERGKANKALVALLADALQLRKSQFRITGGQTARLKRVLVADVTPAEIASRVAGLTD